MIPRRQFDGSLWAMILVLIIGVVILFLRGCR
jgi:hypothetical protein